MFKRTNPKDDFEREFDLPTLIDVIFLLLIFFIATLSLSSGENDKTPTPDSQRRFELPQASGRTSKNEDNILRTLMFQIEREDGENPESAKVLYVLWPNESAGLTENTALRTIRDGLDGESPDSTYYAVFPDNLLELEGLALDESRPFKLMADNIRLFQEQYFGKESYSNTIEVRATKETEFKVISYILNQCSQYDNKIPKVTFRVMAPEDMGDEINDS